MLLPSILSVCFAAIPGTPENPPYQCPPVSVEWSNDWFAFPSGMSAKQDDPNDDFRTNEFTVIGRTNRFRFVFDDSMLTSKVLGERADEMTATAGVVTGRFVVGAGLRSRGNYGGQGLQNWFHGFMHDTALHLNSESRSYDGLAYVVLDQPVIEGNDIGLQPVASCMIATDGEISADAGGRIVVGGPRFSAWLGLRYQLRSFGSGLSEVVQKHETDLCVEYGLSWATGFSFSAVLYKGTGLGSLGYNF